VEARGVHRKLTAILSADVVGYSRLMAEDDIATVRMLTEHRGLMKILVEGYRGRVVDSPGDNVLAEFPSVVDAVECAVVIQKELKSQNDRLPENRRMQFRIGINLGDVIVDGDRIYGDGVNIAARLESLAEPGGICVSGSAYDQIENKLPLGYQSLGPQVVKNFSKPVRVYRAVTSVEPNLEPTAPEPVPVRTVETAAAPPRRRTALVAGLVIAVVAVGGVAAWRLAGPAATTAATPPAIRKPSLAVLPIVNTSGDATRDAVTAQLDEAVRTGLSRLSGVTTSSASAVQPYRSRSVSVSQAARELDVRYVLDGSVRVADGRPRLVASLIDTSTGNTVWTERFDQTPTNVAAVQNDLVQRIIAALPITLTAEEQAARHTKKTPATAAPGVKQRAPAKTLDTAVDAQPSSPRAAPAPAATPAVARDTQRVEPAPTPQRVDQAQAPPRVQQWAPQRDRETTQSP
jgi:adenylate cyclase